MKKTAILLSLAASLLAGCGPGPQTNGEQDGQRVEMKLNIPKDTLEALDKARGVEQTLQDSDDRRRESLREY